jgi:two-component system, sensor histidine kinase YesM
MNLFKRYRIDKLLFYCFTVAIALVLICTILVSYQISSRELASTTSYYQQRMLDELNSEIAIRLKIIEQISLSVSRDAKMALFLESIEDPYEEYRRTKEVEKMLANLTYSIPQIQAITLYMEDPFQEEVIEYIQFRSLENAYRREWYPSLAISDFIWSGEHSIESFEGQVPVISFLRKIINDENELVGILSIHVKANMIRSILAEKSGKADRLMLDSTGRKLLSVGIAPEQAELTSWMIKLDQQSGVFRSPIDNGKEDSLIVYSKITDSDWLLVEVTPWEHVTLGSLKLAIGISIIGFIAILLSIFLTFWLSRQFTKPIRQLVDAMNRYSFNSNSSIRLPEDYRNEFGYLFSGYRKQIQRIEELYLSLQQRYENQRRAELEALQANINPHFLYNTLDQLNWLAIEAGQSKMSRILELMGRMFRVSLSNGESLITIQDEITHIESYLEIQRLRLGDELNYSIHVDDSLKSLYIPKMTLQPFVENSIIHGLHSKNGGNIAICIELKDDIVRIRIKDDGLGLNSLPRHPKKRQTGGYGIRNVRERFAAYFGNSYLLEITSRDSGGTDVLIQYPKLETRPDQESTLSNLPN